MPSAAADSPCLVQIYGPSLGKKFPLLDSETTIGREEGCGIVLELDTVSRSHCSLLLKDGAVVLRDNGSTNGSWLNGAEIEAETTLRSGDLLKIGGVIFKFLSGGELGTIEAQYHEEIYRLTIVDGLTQLFNKRYLLDFIERELARSARHERVMSLAMFDIDHFKAINDARGHSAGDFVIRELSAILKNRIRREECLARYGGEEFVAVLPETELTKAAYFADMLRKLVEKQQFVYDGKAIAVTFSAGVAQFSKEHRSAQAFIDAADARLYEAKRRGRNQVVAS